MAVLRLSKLGVILPDSPAAADASRPHDMRECLGALDACRDGSWNQIHKYLGNPGRYYRSLRSGRPACAGDKASSGNGSPSTAVPLFRSGREGGMDAVHVSI